MKVVKPQALGLLPRVIERGGECFLVVAPMVFFDFGASPGVLTEADMWNAMGELGDQVLDPVLPKLRGEVFVWGSAHPEQPPKPTAVVRLRIGRVDKQLFVVGDREWHKGVPTNPTAFDEMPIRWARAFGGEGYGANPAGKGFPHRGEDGSPLPNVEDPAHMIRAPRDRPTPAGLAPEDMTWPDRRKLLGTYDKKWQETRYPGFPDDMMWSATNLAPQDQQIDGFFRGDETFSVDGMHPAKVRVEGKLPGMSARVFLRAKGSEALSEVTTRLDTVWIFPHKEQGVVIFRGLARVAEDDAHDVDWLMAALERAEAPRGAAHYIKALDERQDRQKAAILAVTDEGLVPEGLTMASANPKQDDGVKSDGHLGKRVRAMMDLRFAEARQKVLDEATRLKMDVSQVQLPERGPDPPPPPPTDVGLLRAYVAQVRATAEGLKARAAEIAAEARPKVQEQLEKQGRDLQQIEKEIATKAGGPPPKMAGSEQAKTLRDQIAKLGDKVPPEARKEVDQLDQRLKDADDRVAAAYKSNAQHFPAARRLEGDDAARLRQEVIAAHARKESMAERNLTGADLSGLDLTGADLRGAMLESANLTGAQLGGARLSGAVLARADLTKVNLFAAKLDGANLGAATLAEAELGECDLTRATLAKANLTGARLRGARFDKVDLTDCALRGSDWSGVVLPQAKLIKLDLSGMKLAGADLSRAVFVECTLDDVDASGAKLGGCSFVKARGERVVLRGALLDAAAFVGESSLPGVDLRGASLLRINLRGTCLAGADLSGARMDGADLSECDLKGATLERARARGARFDRADLTGANLHVIDLMNGSLAKARLHGADLRVANLFGADLARVRLDQTTRVTGANLLRARMLPAHKEAK
jgi:uncharacterized protein YjbI with pentapeptide repeats